LERWKAVKVSSGQEWVKLVETKFEDAGRSTL